MKIVLPKTLAEPWAIPWIRKEDVTDADIIIEILHKYFKYLDNNLLGPSIVKDGLIRFSRVTVCGAIRHIVMKHRGTVLGVETSNRYSGNHQIGYTFVVHFTIPGRSDKTYTTRLISWF